MVATVIVQAESEAPTTTKQTGESLLFRHGQLRPPHCSTACIAVNVWPLDKPCVNLMSAPPDDRAAAQGGAKASLVPSPPRHPRPPPAPLVREFTDRRFLYCCFHFLKCLSRFYLFWGSSRPSHRMHLPLPSIVPLL